MLPRFRFATLLSFAFAGACDSDTISGPSGPVPVALNFCGFPPMWFAVQNDGAAWQRVDPDATGVIRFGATDKVSVAFVFGDASISLTQVVNTSASDLTTGFACEGDFGNKSLTGSVAGIAGEQIVRLELAGQSDLATVAQPSFAFDFLPNGPIDLVALRFATSFTSAPDRVILRRGIVPQGSAIPTLDFAAAEAQPLTAAIATFTNLGNDFGQLTTEFLTANGTVAGIADLSIPGGTAAAAYHSIPASLQSAQELHTLSAFASSSAGSRSYARFYKTAGDFSLTFGPQVPAPTVTQVAGTPVRRMRATVASQPEYPHAIDVGFSQPNQSVYRAVSVVTTSSFLSGTPTTWDVTIPDFQGTGYQSTWGLQPSVATSWDVTAYGSSSGSLSSTPADGLVILSANATSSGAPLANAFSTKRRKGTRPWFTR